MTDTNVVYRVILEKDGQKEIEGEYDNREEAALRLIDVLAMSVSNFDEYTPSDIDWIMEEGKESFGRGSVYIDVVLEPLRTSTSTFSTFQ